MAVKILSYSLAQVFSRKFYFRGIERVKPSELEDKTFLSKIKKPGVYILTPQYHDPKAILSDGSKGRPYFGKALYKIVVDENGKKTIHEINRD